MKQTLTLTALLAAGLTVAQADLVPYAEDFEALDALGTDPDFPLADAGWLVFGNVFNNDFSAYLYGYGVFGAPNGTPGFCSISTGQGGPEQGAQGLVIYSDYNNGDQAAGGVNAQVEANVFQEWTVGAGDVGATWTFKFDAKAGDLVAPSTALAFIKTLDPNAGYATTNFLTVNTSALPATWGTYMIDIEITAGLVGQLLQVGFAATANNYVASGVFYDNVSFLPPGGFPPPKVVKIVSLTRAPGQFTITWESEEGVEYDVEKSTDLENDIWNYVGPPVIGGPSGMLSVTDVGASALQTSYKVTEVVTP